MKRFFLLDEGCSDLKVGADKLRFDEMTLAVKVNPDRGDLSTWRGDNECWSCDYRYGGNHGNHWCSLMAAQSRHATGGTAHVSTHTHTHTHTHVRPSVRVYVCVCARVCMYMCAFICMHPDERVDRHARSLGMANRSDQTGSRVSGDSAYSSFVNLIIWMCARILVPRTGWIVSSPTLSYMYVWTGAWQCTYR